jgi:integrase
MTTGTAITVQSSNLDLILKAIANAPKLQDSTRNQYRKAIINAVEAGVNLLDAGELNEYAKTVGSSTRSFLSAGIRLLTTALELEAKSSATPENVASVQALCYRTEALRESVETETHKGTKAHTWLSQKEIKLLLNACGIRKSGNAEFPIVAQRDRLAIALLVGAGLRRAEAVSLCFEDMIAQPTKTGTRYVLNVTGKGAKDRVVPISNALATMIRAWREVVGDGFILRALGRDKQPGESMTTTALYDVVQKRGAIAGKDDLQPHDLRRSFAQTGYEAGVPVAQISLLLGHSDIQTTMTYLNIELDVETTISDFIPL